MKILLCSHAYAPSVGGIETLSRLLAAEFVARGHEVVIVTQTAGVSPFEDPCAVVRRPSAPRLLRLVSWADVVFHNHISLRTAWPLLAIRRPWVVAHHTWIPDSFAGRVKKRLLRHAANIACSEAIAARIPAPAEIIANPYDDAAFRVLPDGLRHRDLVFVGRLIRDKGAHLVIEAMARLRAQGQPVTLTVIGSGPEEPVLRSLVDDLALRDQVQFAGSRLGAELVGLLNQHRVLVVPSIWEEPFGIVALEGMACGCAVIASDRGGLPDAIGSAGLTFPGDDAGALSQAIDRLLGDSSLYADLLARAPAHLANHRLAAVAGRYLQVMTAAPGNDE